MNAIESPSELGAGTDGGDIKANMQAMDAYTELLLQGSGPANALSSHNIPLGDRYFISTGGKCKPVNIAPSCLKSSCSPATDLHPELGASKMITTVDGNKIQVVPRSMIVNNIPGNNSPSPAQTAAMKKSSAPGSSNDYNGLIPGVFDDVLKLNPLGLFTVFFEPAFPECGYTTINAVKGPGVSVSTESAWVAKSDLIGAEPCAFKDNKNPLTGATCNAPEGFTTLSPQKLTQAPERFIIPKNKVVHFYMILVSLLGSYLLYKMLFKNRQS